MRQVRAKHTQPGYVIAGDTLEVAQDDGDGFIRVWWGVPRTQSPLLRESDWFEPIESDGAAPPPICPCGIDRLDCTYHKDPP